MSIEFNLIFIHILIFPYPRPKSVFSCTLTTKVVNLKKVNYCAI